MPLLQAHEQEWAGPLSGWVDRVSFYRGFVGNVHAGADTFLRHADTIFRVNPVRRLVCGGSWEDPQGMFIRLGTCPHLARLKAIYLIFEDGCVGDPDLQTLGTLPPLLRLLDGLSVFECPLSEAGLRPVLTSPHLRQLRQLELPGCQLGGAEGVGPLADSPSLKHLWCLRLEDNPLGDRGLRRLVASPNCRPLEYLQVDHCDLGDEGAAAVAGSPHLPALEELDMSGNRITDAGARALAMSPHLGRLRTLFVSGNNISRAGVEQLKGRLGEGLCW